MPGVGAQALGLHRTRVVHGLAVLPPVRRLQRWRAVRAGASHCLTRYQLLERDGCFLRFDVLPKSKFASVKLVWVRKLLITSHKTQSFENR